MKLYTQTNKIISLPVSRNSSSKNSFLQKQKLAFTNLNTKTNEDYYNIKTPRIRSPNLSNKKEKTLGTINSFRLYSKSRSKEKYIKEIENKCPGGTKCINTRLQHLHSPCRKGQTSDSLPKSCVLSRMTEKRSQAKQATTL